MVLLTAIVVERIGALLIRGGTQSLIIIIEISS